MSGYTKLFSSILDSTVWQEPHSTVRVWITMLAMSDAGGFVAASMPGLASRARVSLEDCIKAVDTFLAPDEWSRTKDHDGRRIVAVDGGWALLNHAKYRAIRAEDDRREYQRQLMAERRKLEREAKLLAEKLENDANTLADVSNVSRSKPPLAHASASAESKAQEQSQDQKIAATPGEKPPVDDPPPADPIWGNGLDFLLRKGIAKGAARSLIGLMRKHLQDDFIVAELLIEAERQDICAPQAWLLQAAKQRKHGGTNATNRQSPKLSLADKAAQLMLERRQKRAAEAEAAIVGHGTGRALAHDA